jgi:hypothetical protein
MLLQKSIPMRPGPRRLDLVVGPALFLALFVAGCGGGEASLSGRVIASGQPAAGARLEVESLVDPARRGTGAVLADGTYRIDYGTRTGLPPGECRIEIRHSVTPEGGPLPTGEAGLAARQAGAVKAIHVQFIRPLAAGANAVNFELDEGEPVADSKDAPEAP